MVHGGKLCVAHGPDGRRCASSQHTPGVSLHNFPDRKKDPRRFRSWVRFVRRHRPKWTVSSHHTTLCGLHFEESCFHMRRDIALSLGIRSYLNHTAVPTIDAARQSPKAKIESGPREKRKKKLAMKGCKDRSLKKCKKSSQRQNISTHELVKGCDLAVDELNVQHCEEEQVPKKDVVRSSYNGENGDKTWYPSECVLGEWKQGMQRTSEGKLELQQDELFTQPCKQEQVSDEDALQSGSDDENAESTWNPDVPEEQLFLSANCKEEQISDEDVMNFSDEEDIDSTWYSDECVLENWKEGEEVASKCKENVRQVSEKNQRDANFFLPSDDIVAGNEEISLSTPSSIVSAKFLGAVHSAANTERPRLNRKRSYSESSIAEIKEAKARQESDRRWRCLIEGKQMVDAATQVVDGDNFACNTTSCTYCRLCFSKDFILQHEKNCSSTTFRKVYHHAEYVSNEQHTDVHKSPYFCDICGKESARVSYLTQLRGPDGGEAPYSYDIYSKEFSDVGSLDTQNGADAEEQPFICDVCGMLFTHVTSFIQHKRMHATDRPRACDICVKQFAQLTCLTQHRHAHTCEKPHTCDTCGKGFAFVGHLTEHKRIHTGEKPYICTVCGKGFGRMTSLRRHRRIHTGEKPYICDICGKGFADVGNLASHKRTHTGEMPYICDVCGKRFAQASTCNQHRQSHTGEKPYACDVCGKDFTRLSHVTEHRRSHTGEKPYVCDICGKGFSRVGIRNRHRHIHAREEPHNCEIMETMC